MNMSNLTISAAFCDAQRIWFADGDEDLKLRLDAVTWLKKPQSIVPALILDIARSVGLSIQQAITMAKIIDNGDGARLDRSRSFLSLPIFALDIWHKANEFYQTNLHQKNSGGAAHKKLMYGQELKNGFKPGLISELGDTFTAYVAYYMAHGGMRAIREVQRCLLAWSTDKIREMVLLVIKASHKLIDTIGKRGLKALLSGASAGMGMFPILFSALSGRIKVKSTMSIKTVKATKKIVVENENDNDDEEYSDSDEAVTDIPDADDEADATNHVPADGPRNHWPADEFDDPEADDPDDAAPEDDPPGPSKLRMGRELAWEMLRQAKRNARQHQRYAGLMAAIDDQILLNAMQKGLRPTDLAVAENMANFLSFCWQWAERKGVFTEKSQQNMLDMPANDAVRRIIAAAQNGYWETGDNKPADAGKIWIDVMHADRNGRQRIAVLTRPATPGLQTKEKMKGCGKIISEPDGSLPEFFFHHIKNRKSWPSEKNTRYFIISSNDGSHEIITAQRFVHLRGGVLDSAFIERLDNPENENKEHEYTVQDMNTDDSPAPAFDFPPGDEDTARMVAAETGTDPGMIRRVLAGDDRAQRVLARACQDLPQWRKERIEARFSQNESETDEAAGVAPSSVDQATRRELAKMLNLDFRTLEKAFLDDTDSVMTLKRAIRAMPEHQRAKAVRMIGLSAGRHSQRADRHSVF